MSDLTRTQSGGFELGQTMKLAEIKVAVEQNTIDQKLFPLDYALAKFPVVELSDELWQAVQHGIWLTFDEVASQKPVVALRANDQIKALYQRNEERQCYKPLRMFSIE